MSGWDIAIQVPDQSTVRPLHFPDLVLRCGGCRDDLLEQHHSSVRDDRDVNAASESSLDRDNNCLAGEVWGYELDGVFGCFQGVEEEGV